MFGHQFYPTPPEIASLMVEALGIENNSVILDPSAGKGDLLRAASHKAMGGVTRYGNRKGMYAVEIDPDLSKICAEYARVIGSDFLQFDGRPDIDRIIMNPPFDAGSKHLLHAWRILRHGVIVCILNAETVNNPHTEERQRLLKLIEDYGIIQPLGRVFLGPNVQRKADVDVVMVKLTKPEEMASGFWEGLEFEQGQGYEEQDNGNGLGFSAGPIRRRVRSFQYALAKLTQALELQRIAAEVMMNDVLKIQEPTEQNPYPKRKTADISDIVDLVTDKDQGSVERNVFTDFSEVVDSLTKRAWRALFEDMGLRPKRPAKRYEEFEKQAKAMHAMAFTEANIWAVIQMVGGKRDEIGKETVKAAFLILTQHYPGNRDSKGWKTNDQYKVRQKVIMPRWGHDGMWKVDDDIRDVDKAMCAVTGQSYDTIRPLWRAIDCARYPHYSEAEKYRNPDKPHRYLSTFFEVERFSNGNIHLWFRYKDVWGDFNRAAAEIFGWQLPGKTDKNNTGRHWGR